jgi:POT family proton-dependent oligopeptide transporter
VAVITDKLPEFAESAPPDYFKNADPTVPRPARDTYEVVSEEQYKKLKEEKALEVVEGKKVYVTQKLLDSVYARTTPQTPLLAEGKQLHIVNSELFQSIDPFIIISMTPLVVAFWGWLRYRGLEPDTPLKIGLSLFIIACSPLIMWGATYLTHDGQTKGTAWWLIGTYAAVAMGEIWMSPIGLSLVNKMSPARISAFMMGGWFLATAIGLKISGILGETYQKADHLHFWLVLTGCNVAVGLLVIILLPWLRRQMAEPEPIEGAKPL